MKIHYKKLIVNYVHLGYECIEEKMLKVNTVNLCKMCFIKVNITVNLCDKMCENIINVCVLDK